MATALVERIQRRKFLGDKESPMVYALKRKNRDAKTYDLERLAQEIEDLGGMSAEDVLHVCKSLVRNIKQKLVDGNTVKLDGFGIFRTTFHCIATEEEKDCTVKNIDKVRVQFRVDNAFRLVNDTLATTKGAPNNMVFELVQADGTTTSTGGSSSSGGGTQGGGEDQEGSPL